MDSSPAKAPTCHKALIGTACSRSSCLLRPPVPALGTGWSYWNRTLNRDMYVTSNLEFFAKNSGALIRHQKAGSQIGVLPVLPCRN